MLDIMFRRLIDWLRRQWMGSPFRHPPTPDKLAMDIDEFASLLQSGRPKQDRPDIGSV
jgi:hypothetical protein